MGTLQNSRNSPKGDITILSVYASDNQILNIWVKTDRAKRKTDKPTVSKDTEDLPTTIGQLGIIAVYGGLYSAVAEYTFLKYRCNIYKVGAF